MNIKQNDKAANKKTKKIVVNVYRPMVGQKRLIRTPSAGAAPNGRGRSAQRA
jgi:hypothetical protein